MSDLIVPFIRCPHCRAEVDPVRRSSGTAFEGHRMIFAPGWMHHGEPDWECDLPTNEERR